MPILRSVVVVVVVDVEVGFRRFFEPLLVSDVCDDETEEPGSELGTLRSNIESLSSGA